MNCSQENKRGFFRSVTEIAAPYRGKMVIMIAAGAFCSACDAAYPLFNRYALDNFAARHTLEGMNVFVLLYAAVLLLQTVGGYISAVICGKLEVSVNRDLRDSAFRRLQDISLSYFNKNSIGAVHSRVMSDTSRIGETVSWKLMDVIWNGAYLVGAMINMAFISMKLFSVTVLFAAAAALISAYFRKKLLAVNREIRQQNSVITGDFNQTVTGIRAVKSMTMEKHSEKDFFEDSLKMKKLSVKSGHISALFSSAVGTVGAAVLASVLWGGGALTMQGIMNIGTLSVFMSYALGMTDPIQNIIRTFSDFMTVQANLERYNDLMGTVPDVADTEEVIAKYGDAYRPKTENWEDMNGDILFDDVTFRYPDGDSDVLSRFTLSVPKGSMVAIVGETGAGKSTLVNLVCRFYEPVSGRVLIDGRDIRERSAAWLHSHIGYVLQTPHLFSGTIRDNLRYAKPDASDEEIRAALSAVSALDIVEQLDGGLDCMAGEGGSSLSTGQKQLISFARAVLADPDILILDEATSSVDTITEKKIQSAVKKLTDNRTSFVIAHRLSTITGADMIIAVRDGRIVEQGTHSELMAKKGCYFSLYTRQHEDIDIAAAN